MDMAFIDISCIVTTCKCDFNTRELALIGSLPFWCIAHMEPNHMYKLYVHHYNLLLKLQKIEQKKTYIYIYIYKALVSKHALRFKLQISTNSCHYKPRSLRWWQNLAMRFDVFQLGFFPFVSLCGLKDNTSCLLYQDPLLNPKHYKKKHTRTT
jgi:hypothetical protein